MLLIGYTDTNEILSNFMINPADLSDLLIADATENIEYNYSGCLLLKHLYGNVEYFEVVVKDYCGCNMYANQNSYQFIAINDLLNFIAGRYFLSLNPQEIIDIVS